INIFFFSSRRRHTRSKRDWSSDVCSSDLSDILNLTITTETGLDYESIKAEAMDVLSEEGFTTSEELSSKTYITENTELKMMIILFGLLIGGIVGIIRAAADNSISTEEDIEHYLNERTLGTF